MTPEMIVALTGMLIAISTGLPALIVVLQQGRKQSNEIRVTREAIVAAQTTAELDRLYKRIETLEGKISALEKADNDKAAIVTTLQEQLKTALTRIEDLQRQLKAALDEIAMLKAALIAKDKGV